MDARTIEAHEVVPASRKLGREQAEALVAGAKQVVVAKGKQVRRLVVGEVPQDEIVAAMLGPTGNLRAPTVVVGTTILVGFSAEAYQDVFG